MQLDHEGHHEDEEGGAELPRSLAGVPRELLGHLERVGEGEGLGAAVGLGGGLDFHVVKKPTLWFRGARLRRVRCAAGFVSRPEATARSQSFR